MSFVISHLSFAQEATPSGEDKARQILEAVREKIKAKQMEPKRKAYVGTLKSISNSTLVLETRIGIKQVKVSSEAAFLRINETVKKEIKFDDLTIGELTIAMGYVADNEVLEAKRIIISEEPKEEPKREAVCGTIEEINLKKNIIVIKELKTEKTWSLKITSKTEITKKKEGEIGKIDLEEIETGERLVAIGFLGEEENSLKASRIYIFPVTSKE